MIKKMKIKNLLLTCFFLAIASCSCLAQDSTHCFSVYQLLKMQKSSLDDNRFFLSDSSWVFDGIKSNEHFKYFDFNFGDDYNVVTWNKNDFGEITLYLKSDIANIVFFQPIDTCFKKLMKKVSSKYSSNTQIVNNVFVNKYKIGDVTLELREFKDARSVNQYSILVYKTLEIENKIKSLQNINSVNQTDEKLNSQIYTVVEEMPEFPGGEKAMLDFISKNIRYPNSARENNIEGTVKLQFVINTVGEITDITVLTAVGGGCTEEFIRVIKMMPKWIPGKQNGVNVPVYYNLSTKFKTNSGD